MKYKIIILSFLLVSFLTSALSVSAFSYYKVNKIWSKPIIIKKGESKKITYPPNCRNKFCR